MIYETLQWVLEWCPVTNGDEMPRLADRVEYAQLFHDGSEIHLQSNGHDDSLTLTLPVQCPDVLVPVLELFLR